MAIFSQQKLRHWPLAAVALALCEQPQISNGMQHFESARVVPERVYRFSDSIARKVFICQLTRPDQTTKPVGSLSLNVHSAVFAWRRRYHCAPIPTSGRPCRGSRTQVSLFPPLPTTQPPVDTVAKSTDNLPATVCLLVHLFG